ncbi:Relaxase/Mobilisation nuclease domain-containing protein [Formivibrio citricus]|uniref:Relaxase/Mobilisation nuclease domain-containing protein n=1 Tax=Formivibrio citricus TaxID=83765 RepID=A0A1I5AW10_9NEIS|nr:relaxase/mobilization nuclease domain-containing protein [Formivibrio citricus]SFN66634.1 Relaxase/Mobilisation nuclease domain-containing protein [Formivibrio citricus]
MIADKIDLPDAADVFRSVLYIITPKPENEQSAECTRVLAVAADYIVAPLLIINPELEAERIATQMEAAARRMRMNREMPQNLAQRIVIALSPDDFPSLSRAQVAQKAIALARESTKNVTKRRRMAIYVVHGDRKHIHVHCIIGTVDLEVGLIFNPHRDYRLWELEMERQEIFYKLTRVIQREAVAIRDRDPSRRIRRAAADGVDLQLMKKRSQAPWNTRVQDKIDQVLACATNMGQFLLALEKAGVTPFPRVTAGKCVGIAFRYDGNTKKGRALGCDYSFKGLLERGIEYDVERDHEVIEIFCAKSVALRAGAEVAMAAEAVQTTPPALPSVPEPVVSTVPAQAEIHVVEHDMAISIAPELTPSLPKIDCGDEGVGIASPVKQRTCTRIISNSEYAIPPAKNRHSACASPSAAPVIPHVSGKPAAHSPQVVDEYWRRVKNMPVLRKKSGIERIFAERATWALQASGEVLGKVDWQQVEEAALLKAVLEGVPHEKAIYAIADLSPRLADPAQRMAFLQKFAPEAKSSELGDKTECLVGPRRG